MAYENAIAGAYQGRPAFDLYLYVRRDQVDAPNNRSSAAWELRARNPSRSRLTYALDQFPWSVNVGGYIWNGMASLDFRGGQEFFVLGAGTTGWLGHDAAGNLNITFDAHHFAGYPFGTADPAPGILSVDRIAKRPGTPFAVSLGEATTNSLRFVFSGTTDGGSPILEWQASIDDDPNFGSPITVPSAGNTTFTLLQPNTAYRASARGRNAVGWSDWSPITSAAIASTLPATAPAISVAPSLTGTQATVTLAPPGGTGQVTSYRVERRLVGYAAVTVNSPTSPIVMSGLVPGSTYEYRASAFIGTYQSPWSDWVTVSQPKPNTNPGDYFDGSTAAKTDVTYSWLGAAGNSLSRATGIGVAGWSVDSYVNGGVAVVHRITGGNTQRYSARVLVLGDAAGAGIRAGQSKGAVFASDVTPGGLYRGYIAVRPSRAQRVVAEISWWTAAHALVSREIVTAPVVVAASNSFRTLTGTATAPPTAEFGTINVLDVAGTGHSPWKSGEFYDLDSGFLTLGAEAVGYFDGNTPDTELYTYDWLGVENQSVSQRTTEIKELPNPLADPDCDPIPGAPQPPVIANACIDEVGTWRRYWAIIPESEVFDFLTVVPTIELSTAGSAARQVRIRFYANPEGLPPEDADGTPMQSEQIVSYIPPNTKVVIDAVSETAWAVVGASTSEIPAEELLFGTGGGPATWPELSCGTAYLVSFDVPLDAPIGNLSIAISLTTRMS